MDTLIKVVHPSYYVEILQALMVCDVWFEYRPATGDVYCHDISKPEVWDILTSEQIESYKFDFV